MTPLTLALGGALSGALGLAPIGGLSPRKPRRRAQADARSRTSRVVEITLHCSTEADTTRKMIPSVEREIRRGGLR
jgi:hypothetical protein